MEKDIRYDRNGNVISLTRYNSEVPSRIGMEYDGSRLVSASDTTGNARGKYWYSYDLNGNLSRDGREGLEYSNNILNLPGRVSDGMDETRITYLPDGTKTGGAGWNGTGVKYRGRFVYQKPSAGVGYKLSSVLWDEGMILPMKLR